MPKSSYKKAVAVGTKAGKKAAKEKLQGLTGKERALTRRETIDKALKEAGA